MDLVRYLDTTCHLESVPYWKIRLVRPSVHPEIANEIPSRAVRRVDIQNVEDIDIWLVESPVVDTRDRRVKTEEGSVIGLGGGGSEEKEVIREVGAWCSSWRI